jgi:chromate transport protein ChrA
VVAGGIASLGFVVPVALLMWGALVAAKKYRRRPA